MAEPPASPTCLKQRPIPQDPPTEVVVCATGLISYLSKSSSWVASLIIYQVPHFLPHIVYLSVEVKVDFVYIVLHPYTVVLCTSADLFFHGLSEAGPYSPQTFRRF